MPVVGEFHGVYWNLSDSQGPQPGGAGGGGGYPAWQAAVIAPSLLGMIGAWLDTQIARVRWGLRLLRRVSRLDPERQALVSLVLDTVERPAFLTAQTAVRETAVTLGFNRPEAWIPYQRFMKSHPGIAENAFRHQRAMTRLRELAPSTLSNSEQNWLVEVAYQGFAIMGR